MTVNAPRIVRAGKHSKQTRLEFAATSAARSPKQNAGSLRSRRCYSRSDVASALLFEVRAQRVDRGELHHALRQLRFDRAVGIERVGHAVDHAGLEDRGSPLGGGLRRISGIRFSVAGRVSRGRAGIGGSGISSAGSRFGLDAWARLGDRVARSAARRRDPATPDRTSPFPSAARPAAWRAASAVRTRGASRGSSEPASRFGDQTFGSSAGSIAGGIAGRCGERGDSGASSVSSTIGGSASARRHRRGRHRRRHGLRFRAQPIQRTGRRLAGGRGETRLGRQRGSGARGSGARGGSGATRLGSGDGSARRRRRRQRGGRRGGFAPIRPARHAQRLAPERLGDPPQLAEHQRQPDQDQAARDRDRARNNERVAQAERIDRNTKSDRHQAGGGRPAGRQPSKRESSGFRPLTSTRAAATLVNKLWRPSGSSARTCLV